MNILTLTTNTKPTLRHVWTTSAYGSACVLPLIFAMCFGFDRNAVHKLTEYVLGCRAVHIVGRSLANSMRHVSDSSWWTSSQIYTCQHRCNNTELWGKRSKFGVCLNKKNGNTNNVVGGVRTQTRTQQWTCDKNITPYRSTIYLWTS